MRGFVRALRRELRRGPAWLLATAVTGIGVLALFGDAQAVAWSGRWFGLAEQVRQLMVFALPLTVGAGCWAAGRPRRRGTSELLASTPRPGWQAQVVQWAGSWLGGVAGLALVFGIGAAFVAPVASYAGGGWWWGLLVTVPTLTAGAALGAAVGAWSPWRATAVALTLVLFGAVGWTGLGLSGGASSLLGRFLRLDTLITIDVPAVQLAWFGGLTSVLLAVAAAAARPASRRWLAGALVVGALLALPSGSWLRQHRDDDAPWDPAALELVCTPDEPRVCLHRVDAFALDQLAPRAQALLRRLAPVPGMPRTVLPFDEGAEPAFAPDDVMLVLRPDVDVLGRVLARDTNLTSGEDNVGSLFGLPVCPGAGPESNARTSALATAAISWALQRTPVAPSPEDAEAWNALQLLPFARQVAFVDAVAAARKQCRADDVPRLRGLLGLS